MMPGTDDGAHLERESARLEQLLDELHGMAGPVAWQRIEELMRGVTELYGAGLARLLAIAADDAPGDGLDRRVCADPLLSSLLLLHGLHPLQAAERISRALEELKAELGVVAELIALEDGVARVRATRAGGCGDALAAAIERAVEDVAPEIERVELETADSAERLVQIDLRRGRGSGA